MRRAFFFLLTIAFVFTGCVVYTEKTSKALSVAAWATKDSADNLRYDLVPTYANQACELIKPPTPKDRIKIEAIVKPQTNNSKDKGKGSKPDSGKRVIVLPPGLDPKDVVVVNSAEYEELLKLPGIANQLKADLENAKKSQRDIEAELSKQKEYESIILEKLHSLEKTDAEKSLTILRLRVLLTGICLAISLYIFAKVKGIVMPFPF